jgi:putative FmdB family regulatory protein
VPIYEYECDACRSRFERRQGFHDEPVAECPECQGPVRRLIHPAPIIFKGSGFYVTDSRGRNAAAEAASDGAASAETAAAGEGSPAVEAAGGADGVSDGAEKASAGAPAPSGAAASGPEKAAAGGGEARESSV